MTTRASFWTLGPVALAAALSLIASSATFAAARPGSAKPATVGRALGNFTPASADPVSYTHSTPPTKRKVMIARVGYTFIKILKKQK